MKWTDRRVQCRRRPPLRRVLPKYPPDQCFEPIIRLPVAQLRRLPLKRKIDLRVSLPRVWHEHEGTAVTALAQRYGHIVKTLEESRAGS
jgi:hypothetical protein